MDDFQGEEVIFRMISSTTLGSDRVDKSPKLSISSETIFLNTLLKIYDERGGSIDKNNHISV
jgi:hypothetical protein